MIAAVRSVCGGGGGGGLESVCVGVGGLGGLY